SRDSSVCIATGYGMDDRVVGIRVPVGGALSPGVKRPGCEADCSPPTSSKVKKMWIYTSTSLYAFVA
ncbi:hypothetical protein B7P43_G00944, partial [Cryptotermes secundus]